MYYSASTNGFYDRAIHSSIPADAVEITAAQHAALLSAQSAGKGIVPDANGYPTLEDPAAPTPEKTRAARVAAVQSHLDATAQAAGYDNIHTACTYADEPAVAKFQAEGQAFRAWRSLVWAHCHQVLADVQAGVRGIPSAAELIAELPALNLPT